MNSLGAAAPSSCMTVILIVSLSAVTILILNHSLDAHTVGLLFDILSPVGIIMILFPIFEVFTANLNSVVAFPLDN